LNLDKIITQLRTYCDAFGNRVAGAANQYEGVANTSSLALPAAYVYPMGSEAGEHQGQGASLRQILTEHFGVCVILDNSADRRGQEAADLINNLRISLLKAIYNWRVDVSHASRGVYYVGDKDMSMDRARLQWEFEFAVDATLTYMDGYLIPTVPLNQLEVYNTGAQGEAMTVQKLPLSGI
jgi:hypothetical protein